jgi:hypothetical protein
MDRMKLLKPIIIMIALTGSLLSQQFAGFEYTHSSRYLGDMKTQSRVGTIGYRYYYTVGTRIGLYAGVNQFKFLSDDKKSFFMESPSEYDLRADVMHVYSVFYMMGGAAYYGIDGEVSERSGNVSNIIYSNEYRMFEFPIELGLTSDYEQFTGSVGIQKTYFYGTNEKKVLLSTEGNEADLGSGTARSFTEELPVSGKVSINYHHSKTLDIGLTYTQFTKKDYAVQLSLWSPF